MTTPGWQYTRRYQCSEHDGRYSGAEFQEHLKTVHGVTPKGFIKTLRMALDGEGFFTNTFDCDMDGLRFTLTDHGERERKPRTIAARR